MLLSSSLIISIRPLHHYVVSPTTVTPSVLNAALGVNAGEVPAAACDDQRPGKTNQISGEGRRTVRVTGTVMYTPKPEKLHSASLGKEQGVDLDDTPIKYVSVFAGLLEAFHFNFRHGVTFTPDELTHLGMMKRDSE